MYIYICIKSCIYICMYICIICIYVYIVSIDYHVFLYAQFLISFHQTKVGSLKKLLFRDLFVHLQDPAIIFITQIVCLSYKSCSWVLKITSLLRSTTDDHSLVLLDLFVASNDVFVLQCPSIHWGIVFMLLFHFALIFLLAEQGMLLFIAQISISLLMIEMVFIIIHEVFHRTT